MIERDFYMNGQGVDCYWEMANPYDWRILYDEYGQTLSVLKNCRKKLVKRNQELENENCDNVKYVINKNLVDIRLLNSMIKDVEWTMMEIEGHLPYDGRKLLHKKCHTYSDAVLEIRCETGYNPDGFIKFPPSFDVEKLIANKELQKILIDIMNLLCSDVQRKCVYMYYWENMKQSEIAAELGITQQAVAKNIQKSVQKMQNHLKYLDLKDFLY